MVRRLLASAVIRSTSLRAPGVAKTAKPCGRRKFRPKPLATFFTSPARPKLYTSSSDSDSGNDVVGDDDNDEVIMKKKKETLALRHPQCLS